MSDQVIKLGRKAEEDRGEAQKGYVAIDGHRGWRGGWDKLGD